MYLHVYYWLKNVTYVVSAIIGLGFTYKMWIDSVLFAVNGWVFKTAKILY